MDILFLNWRDIKNPNAGGAEVYTHEVARRLVNGGHRVTLYCSFFPGAGPEEEIDGVKIIRRGRQWSVHWHAFRYYRSLQRGRRDGPVFDLVIDEINTIPFFTPLYVKDAPVIAYINQLAGKVWLYEAGFPLSLIGYLAEPLYLIPYRKLPVVTISNSTRDDLIRGGFNGDRIEIALSGIDFDPPAELPQKGDGADLIYVGRLSRSKRPDHAIRAFHIINREVPESRLWIVGEGGERKKLEDLARDLGLGDKVTFWGWVSREEKLDLMRKAHLILVPSVKEGWGIIVTEAAAFGTPAVVYNVDGLKDSVRQGKTGIICSNNTPEDMAAGVLRALRDRDMYQKMRLNAWESSKGFSWDKTAERFIEIIERFT